MKNLDDYKFIQASQSNGLWFEDKTSFASNVYCSADMIVENNLYSNGNLAANNLSLYKDYTASNLNDPIRVGYAFRINPEGQLELLKYGRYFSSAPDVMKKVMVFGIHDILPTHSNDISDYTGFSDLTNVSFTNGRTGLITFGSADAPINGGTVAMNITRYPNAIVELSTGTSSLTIQLHSDSTVSGVRALTSTAIGTKGTITIIERSLTGRSVTSSPSMTLTNGSITTTPAPNIGGYSIDVLEYVIVSASSIPASYSNTLSITGPYTSPVVDVELGSVTLDTNTATYTLSNYFSDPNNQALTYTLVTNPNNNASITSGVLSVVGNYRGASYTVTVRATNTSSMYVDSILFVTENAVPNPTITRQLGTTNLVANESPIYDLSTYFSDPSGYTLTYSITSNPYSTASVSGKVLTLSGGSTDNVYNVTVRASNGYTYAESSLTVTEFAIREYPPSALESAAHNITSGTYGNGYFEVSKSSETSGQEAWKAFDQSSSTYWTNSTTGQYANASFTYSGSTATTVSGTSYAGEWLQIRLSRQITLTSYKLTPNSSLLDRAPASFIIAGSMDGSTWTLVDQRTSVGSLGSGTTFNAGSTTPYIFYRIIVTKLYNTSTYLSLASWQLYGIETREYPSGCMTANTTNLTTQEYGNGTYIASASTYYDSVQEPWRLYDKVLSTWTNGTSATYLGSGGAYTGSVSTTVSGVARSGEWNQIEFPQAITVKSYRLVGHPNYLGRCPKAFVVAGSNDGSTWTLVDQRSNIGPWANAGFTYTVSTPTAYKYYRLIVQQTYVASEATTLTEFQIFGDAPTVLRTTARMWLKVDDLGAIADNSQVTTWASATKNLTATGYTAGSVSYRPIMKRTEAYPFVRIGNTSLSTSTSNGNYFSFGPQTFNIATNNGFTMVCAIRYLTTAAFGRIIDFNNGEGNNNLIVSRFEAGSQFILSYFNSSTNTGLAGVKGTVRTNEWQVIAARFKNNELAFYEASKSTGAGLTLQNKSWTNTFIGKSAWSTDNYANIDIREMLIYDRELTDAQIAELQDYLRNKYSISAS
jgi:hypothetical protein